MSLLALLTGFLAENLILDGSVGQQDIGRFNKVVHQKQDKLGKIIGDVSEKVAVLPENFDHPLFDLLKEYNQLFEKEELSLLVARDNRAVYWSDPLTAFLPELQTAPEGLVRLQNGWYLLSRTNTGPYLVYGLILIKFNYQINNDYLKNRFASDFHIPDTYEVLFYNSEQSYPVVDQDKQFLFSLKPAGNSPFLYRDLYIPVMLYLVSLLLFFVLLLRINNHLFHRYPISKLVALLLFLGSLYLFINHYRLPQALYLLDLFSPAHFAYSSYWTSLGEFLISSIFISFWSINFFRSFNLKTRLKKEPLNRGILLFLCLAVSAIFFVAIRQAMYLLVMNSSISFAVFQVSEMNFFSIIGFFSIGLICLAFLLFTYRITQVFRKESGKFEFFTILALLTALLLLYLLHRWPSDGWYLGIFFLLIVSLGFVVSKWGIITHRLSVMVVFVFVFALLVLFNLLKFIDVKEEKMQQLMVVTLSEERDPVAELFLLDIDAKIKTDTILIQLLDGYYRDVPDYIGDKYFSGYFREYDLQVTVCEPNDSLIVQPENEVRHCFPFFDKAIEDKGISIAGLNFFYLENMNGRITYLGRFEWILKQKRARLYVELNSKMLSEGTGFPELLIPQHSKDNRIRNHFSFAKYNNGELVDRGGKFLYTLSISPYDFPDQQVVFRKWGGYKHCILNLGNNDFILVSKPEVSLYDYCISFPYIFVFFFLLALGIYAVSKPRIEFAGLNKSLRIRIQATIIGVVLFTLMIVGGGTIAFNIWQYRTNHQQALVDKINSISVELDMLMSETNQFDDLNMDYLNRELLRISEVFWIDINLFDLSGRVRASSRPEIFDKGLISGYMDNTAIHFLSLYQPTRYLHSEHIGEMEYLSAYVPLINRSGKNIGYINIPYFTHEKQFRQQITTFVLAFVNIYVLLLMASILVAYYLSGRITDPLKLIRENLRKMQLGKKTKPIRYHSDDEIGLLVAEYNNKLKELAHSADLLARNERELAWREMAKQIAHEIKNPLTPMKLNIQFLQRAGFENTDDYRAKVKKVTDTLIEQIDNLSAIATAFSNFAQIPNARNELFDLAQRLKETIELYEHTGQCEIITRFDPSWPLWVNADKEQFSRAVINLMRNAIQSIADDQKGRIEIDLFKEENNAIISILDNGRGIDEASRESIFMPNFTTKTSGTGLGLAITKNIVQNFNGEIRFESVIGKGTNFFIKMPLALLD